MRFSHPNLAQSLAHLFDSSCLIEKVSATSGAKGQPVYEAVELTLPRPLRARYEGVPVSRLNANQMFDSEAVAVDSVLLNQAVPEVRNGMFVTLQADGESDSKRFYVQDATVTAAGFTMLSVLPRRPKAA